MYFWFVVSDYIEKWEVGSGKWEVGRDKQLAKKTQRL